VSEPRIVDAGPVHSKARLAPLPPNAPRSGGNIFSRALGRTVLALGGWRTSGAWPDLRKVVPGTYFVSALPSHPATGRSLGGGQYHVEAGL